MAPSEVRPAVSVVVACMDCADTLPQLLDSLERQTVRNFELVVVDGGSTDGSLELLAARRELVGALVSEPDGGIYDAWNKGVALGRGDHFLFLGADDVLWDARVMERAAPYLAAGSRARSLVYGQIALLDRDGGQLGRIGRPWQEARREAGRSMPLPFPACFVSAELLVNVGGFDPHFRIAGDFEWALRALRVVEPTFIEDLVVTGMGAYGVSNRREAERTRFAEDLEALRRHGYLDRPGASLRFRLRGWSRMAAAALLGPRAVRVLANRLRRLTGRPILPEVPR